MPKINCLKNSTLARNMRTLYKAMLEKWVRVGAYLDLIHSKCMAESKVKVSTGWELKIKIIRSPKKSRRWLHHPTYRIARQAKSGSLKMLQNQIHQVSERRQLDVLQIIGKCNSILLNYNRKWGCLRASMEPQTYVQNKEGFMIIPWCLKRQMSRHSTSRTLAFKI